MTDEPKRPVMTPELARAIELLRQSREELRELIREELAEEPLLSDPER